MFLIALLIAVLQRITCAAPNLSHTLSHITHAVALQLTSLDLSLNYLAIVDESGTYWLKVAGLTGTLPASWSNLQVCYVALQYERGTLIINANLHALYTHCASAQLAVHMTSACL